MIKSVYIHIPFCSTICSYCDFCKIYYNSEMVFKYLNALKCEIKENYKGEVIDTIYIGGGTPSCLNIKELEKLFEIINLLKKSANLEFTFECNIEDIEINKLKFLYQNGVNRLSIGVQSFNQKLLKLLNRHHSKQEVLDKIKLAKNIGFKNISIDLIYAIKGQSLADIDSDIKNFLKLDINHLSTYSLIIEPHTILYNKNIQPIDEELDYSMYKMICATLTNHGYKHYEISNFAKHGYESKHNLTYWNNESYYGFGAGASGYTNNVRYDNTRNIIKYINKNYKKEEHIMTFNETCENEFILGLRKIDGIDIYKFQNKYGFSPLNIPVVQKLIKSKSLIFYDKYLKINSELIYQENDILCEFLGINYSSFEIVKNVN